MTLAFPPVDSRSDVRPENLMDAVTASSRPVVFKGLVAHWPAVQQAKASIPGLIDYLKACDNGRPAETLRQPPGADGRYFYDDAGTGFNFARAEVPVSVALDRLRSLMGRPDAEHIYIQSAPLIDHLPRFKTENPLPLPGIKAEPRIWIGNRSETQIHFDLYYNLACMVAGRKRFVLFPPEQLPNLYMGPLETTVSGVPTSLANLANPDFAAHPRVKDALDAATVADLEPGDVLYIPYMWWHHVSSSADLNVQVNTWWNPAADLGIPMQALIHAILSLRDLPPDQNAAWKVMFDHFVFHASGDFSAHLKPGTQGIFGDIAPQQRKDIRAAIGRNLQE